MKKTLIAMLSLMLVLVPAVGVSAETGLNASEQKIMDLLRTQVDLGGGKIWSIPVNYLNQAENFFLQYDATEQQATEVTGYIQQGIDRLKANAHAITVSGSNAYDLKGLPYAEKRAILECGQKACAVVGLKLVYDGTNVVITAANDSSKVYFSSAPIIKVTGKGAFSRVWIYSVGAAAAVAIAIAVALNVRKRTLNAR